jgi:hypothetical protein
LIGGQDVFDRGAKNRVHFMGMITHDFADTTLNS